MSNKPDLSKIENPVKQKRVVQRKPYAQMSLEELYAIYTKKAKQAQFKADRIKEQINNMALEEIMKKNKWTIDDVITHLSQYN